MTNESERAKFEAWYIGLFEPLPLRQDGEYKSAVARCMLQSWLARAQSSGPVVAASELEDLTEHWEEFQLSKTPDAQEAMTDCAAQLRDLISKHTGRE